VLVLKEQTPAVSLSPIVPKDGPKDESQKAKKSLKRTAPVDVIELPALLEAKTRELQQDPNMKPIPGLKS
jgi:hypothetical protein